MDMTAFIIEFMLPFWLVSEVCFQIFRYIRYDENQILSSLVLITALVIFFFTGLTYSLKKYNDVRGWQNLLQGCETGMYMVVVWFPVVLFIIFKIIFVKKTLTWGKTEHGNAKEEAPVLVQ